jgi:hypothetical protein
MKDYIRRATEKLMPTKQVPIEEFLDKNGLKYGDVVGLEVCPMSNSITGEKGVCLVVKVNGREIPVTFNKQGALNLAADIKRKAEAL